MLRWRTGAGLLAAALLTFPAPLAAAQPMGQPVPPVAGSPALMELQVDQLTPRLVTSATQQVTIKGKVTNTGDRRLDDVRVRLQRGAAIESERALRDVRDQATDSAVSAFQDVAKSLEPGDSANVSITVPVRGGDRTLGIDEPGVYPVLVNVNGRPDFSDQARLAAVSIPLPVMSVPNGQKATPKAAPPGVTILWPLLDERPRRLPTTNGKPLLVDDELAGSLAVGGRLFDLVNAVRTATATDTTLMRSLCFAVDPDLLDTVTQMKEGYQVRTSGGQLVAGKGSQAATDWLATVQDLTKGHCVLAVPYADADLAALSRAGAVGLAQLALSGSAIVTNVLGVQPAKNLYWPAGGAYDQRTLIDLAAVGAPTVLADGGHLQNIDGQSPYTITGTQTANPVRALPVDSLLADALATQPARSTRPGGPQDQTTRGAVSVQNGLAALTYRAAFDQRGGGQVLVAPPRRWTASGSELSQFLALTRQLFDDGFATALPLGEAVAEPDRGTASGLAYTAEDTSAEVPTSVTAEVMRINATNRDMLDAMADDNTTDVNPNELLSPMQFGLLRGVSTAWRGRTDLAASTVEYVDSVQTGLREQVAVKNPGRPLSLASGDSPIPVTVSNGLPVAVVVRINLSPTPGLRPNAYQDVRIPPLASASSLIPVEVSRSGRFTVDVRLSTPGGTPLGQTVRLELNSTSYGIISVAVTGTAGVILVLLVGVRIFRRVRTARAGGPKTGEEVVDA